jgi:putative glutathione S-transferase
MAQTKDTSHFSDIGKMKVEDDGSFNRKPASFRDFIEKGGKFEPEKGRYHLYISYACPWATRTLIGRQLKGLQDFIDVTVVSPHMGSCGWPFAKSDSFPGAQDDPLYGAEHIRDLYFKANPDFEGRFTVPVLWDKKTHTIVSNESSEILRMFNSAFNHLLPEDKAAIDLYPENLRKEINELNDYIYPNLNSTSLSLYRTSFHNPTALFCRRRLPCRICAISESLRCRCEGCFQLPG